MKVKFTVEINIKHPQARMHFSELEIHQLLRAKVRWPSIICSPYLNLF